MKKVLLAAFTLGTFLLRTEASIILSDTFTYRDGTLVGAPGSPWNSHSGTAGTMLVTNNQLVVYTARSEDVNAPLAGAPYLSSDASAKLYSSLTFIVSNTLPTLAGTYFAHFRGTNIGAATDFGARIFLSTSNSISLAPVPAGKFRLSIGNGAAATNNNLFGQIDVDLSTNVAYTVVTRFVPSTGIATIWLNPTAETDPSATASDPGTPPAPNPFNVYTYAFRQATGEGLIWVDNLKVGTQFADVAGPDQSPTISSIANQNIAANGATAPLAFTVADDLTPAGALIVTASSSNTGLVPNSPANLTLTGSGSANRTIKVTPATGQQGTTTITVNVNDGGNNSFTTFTVTVGAPTITAIGDQITLTNTPITGIPFTIFDYETPGSLHVTASSSNPTLVQNGDISVIGTGTNRTLSISPQANQQGLTVITLRVDDGALTNSTSFFLTVRPALGLVLGDAFDYPDGDLVANSGGFWAGHSDAASNDCFVVNGQLTLTSTNGEDIHAPFTNSVYFPADSGIVAYSKFDVNFTVLPRFSGGSYISHFKDLGTSNFKGRIYALTNGAAPGFFRLGVANGSATVSTVLDRDLSLNTTYTIVSRYNVSAATTTLWVNPHSEGSPSTTAIDSTSAVEIDYYCFRQDGGGGSIGTMLVDNLLVGTSFSDVVAPTVAPSPIPLNIAVSGGNAVFTWSNPAFNLQSASSVGGPWTTIWSATTGYSVPASQTQQFYRLVYQ